jgi:hypothetical protein
VIGRPDIVERVAEWQLTEEIVEKDYVLGWLLWGIGADPLLGDKWVFKGDTCLKKCYIETHRFSEDLDFTVLSGGPYRPEQIEPILGRVLARSQDESGIDFSSRAPVLRPRPDELSTEGRVLGFLRFDGHSPSGVLPRAEGCSSWRPWSAGSRGAAGRSRRSSRRRSWSGAGRVTARSARSQGTLT